MSKYQDIGIPLPRYNFSEQDVRQDKSMRNKKSNRNNSEYLPGFARMIDVARLAGVARVTVSRVLNNTGSVSTARRSAVLAAAERLGYHRNLNAGALAAGRISIVGAVVSDIRIAWIAAAIGDLSNALTDVGFELFLCQSNDNIPLQRRLIDRMRERRVNAIVLLGTKSPEALDLRSVGENAPILKLWKSTDDVAQQTSDLLARLCR